MAESVRMAVLYTFQTPSLNFQKVLHKHECAHIHKTDKEKNLITQNK